MCPYCRTVYRHKSMADRCVKTKLCRTYNAPSEARRNALVTQVGVAAVVQFIMSMLIKQNTTAKEMAKGVDAALESLYPQFSRLQCSHRILEESCGKVADVLVSLWPADKETNAIHMLSVASSLINQLRYDLKDFWEQRPDFAAPGIWKDIEDGVDKIYEFFNRDLSEDYIYAERVPEAYEKLYGVIWPEQIYKKPVKLRLYLVNDLYWVAAEDKAHAKAIVMDKFKCEVTTAEGIQPSEVFEDGSNATDLLELADGKAGIIAGTEKITE